MDVCQKFLLQVPRVFCSANWKYIMLLSIFTTCKCWSLLGRDKFKISSPSTTLCFLQIDYTIFFSTSRSAVKYSAGPGEQERSPSLCLKVHLHKEMSQTKTIQLCLLCACAIQSLYVTAFFYLDLRTGNNFLCYLNIVHIFTYSAFQHYGHF